MTTPRTADLAADLRVGVARLSRRLRRERATHDELTLTQRSVLAVLLRDGELSLGALAEAEGVRAPSMTRTVGCLADAGYVARRPAPGDARRVLVAVTELGRDTILADRRRRDEWLTRQLRGLTVAERGALHAALPILDRLAEQE